MWWFSESDFGNLTAKKLEKIVKIEHTLAKVEKNISNGTDEGFQGYLCESGSPSLNGGLLEITITVH